MSTSTIGIKEALIEYLEHGYGVENKLHTFKKAKDRQRQTMNKK